MNIYFIQYEAVPAKGSDTTPEHNGAFVTGWVKASNLKNATAIYKQTINENAWNLLSLVHAFLVPEGQYSEGDAEFVYYKQAIDEGESYLVDTW